MNTPVKAQNLFRPTKSAAKPATRAEMTDLHAREILQAEEKQRIAKSDRLRRERLRMEATAAATVQADKPRRAAQPKIRRAVSSM